MTPNYSRTGISPEQVRDLQAGVYTHTASPEAIEAARMALYYNRPNQKALTFMRGLGNTASEGFTYLPANFFNFLGSHAGAAMGFGKDEVGLPGETHMDRYKNLRRDFFEAADNPFTSVADAVRMGINDDDETDALILRDIERNRQIQDSYNPGTAMAGEAFGYAADPMNYITGGTAAAATRAVRGTATAANIARRANQFMQAARASRAGQKIPNLFKAGEAANKALNNRFMRGAYLAGGENVGEEYAINKFNPEYDGGRPLDYAIAGTLGGIAGGTFNALRKADNAVPARTGTDGGDNLPAVRRSRVGEPSTGEARRVNRSGSDIGEVIDDARFVPTQAGNRIEGGFSKRLDESQQPALIDLPPQRQLEESKRIVAEAMRGQGLETPDVIALPARSATPDAPAIEAPKKTPKRRIVKTDDGLPKATKKKAATKKKDNLPSVKRSGKADDDIISALANAKEGDDVLALSTKLRRYINKSLKNQVNKPSEDAFEAVYDSIQKSNLPAENKKILIQALENAVFNE